MQRLKINSNCSMFCSQLGDLVSGIIKLSGLAISTSARITDHSGPNMTYKSWLVHHNDFKIAALISSALVFADWDVPNQNPL